MKNLVKLFLIVIAIIMATDKLFSQEFGIKAGFNSSNMHIVNNRLFFTDDSNMKTGFHIGATAEFPLTEIFSLETGLLLSTKGFIFRNQLNELNIGFNYESKVNLSTLYLDIPVTAKASSYIGGTKIYFVFGPYVGIGLSGKMKGEVSIDGETTSQEIDIEWGSDIASSDLKRMDFGLIIGAGVELNSIQIGLNYSLGLANISPQTNVKIRNRVLGISVGYRFGKKKKTSQ
jgi:hypothetical protein